MMDHKPPPHWVTERGNCTVDLMFEALTDVVERDIADANELHADSRHASKFGIEKELSGPNAYVRVKRYPEGEPGNLSGTVTFEKRRCVIKVHLPGDRSFKVTPMWNDKTSACTPCIDEVPTEVWRISQKALSAFIFDPDVD